jgi:hypothetical protein
MKRIGALPGHAATEAATIAGAAGAPADALRAELAMVDDMLSLVEPIASHPDERVKWLVDWIERNLAPDGQWNRQANRNNNSS